MTTWSEWLRVAGAGVGNHLWQSTAFAVVVWLATLLLRKNAARVRYGLWLTASVKFLVPFSLLVGLGGMLPHPQHAVVTMPVYSAVDDVALPFTEMQMAEANPTHAAMRPHHEWGTQVGVVLAGAWLGGVVVVLAVWGGRWRQVARTLGRARRVKDGREAEILRRVQAAMGWRMRAVPVSLSPELMEPGMFGIWRPVLIWPVGLSARLDDEHVEAIMAHELMHARRRDNLTAVLHMVVEAAFWFHPVVWWMERRMVEERERACDEGVVEMGSRPGVYAESLLKACRFCLESPLVCVAGITGADLAARVRGIMALRLRKLSLGGKLGLTAIAVATIAGPVAFGILRMIPMYGQILHATGPLPSFEVATIRPMELMRVPPPPGAGPPRVAPNGEPIISQQEMRISSAPRFSDHVDRITTAKMLIADAYHLPAFSKAQIVGGPDWTEQTMYQLHAKIDDAQYAAMQRLPTAQQAEQVRLMEQSLLAARFQLKVHFETRELPVYALEVAKGGPKLTLAKTDSAPAGSAASSPQASPADVTLTGKGSGFELKGRRASPGQLILFLQQQPELGNRLVIDKTGLAGKYDMTLDWTREGATTADAGTAAADAAPSFFTALKEELGLQLVESKGPVEVVVIDSIEKPTVDGAEVDQGSRSAVQGSREGGTAAVVPAAMVQEKGVQAQATENAVPGCPDAGGLFAAYNVVLVKPANIRMPGFVGLGEAPDGLTGEAVTVAIMVQQAYSTGGGLPTDDAVAKLPDWAKMPTYFSVQAKMNPAQVAAFTKLDKEQQVSCRTQMLRALLRDRFKLEVHLETRQVPSYDLVVASGGPKMKELSASDPGVFIGSGGKPLQRDNAAWIEHGAEEVVRDFTIDQLAAAISGIGGVDHRVVDKTGLTGIYKYTLRYALPHGVGPASAGAQSEAVASDPAPTVFQALQDQLGLQLQRGTATVDTVVVDHVERPAAN